MDAADFEKPVFIGFGESSRVMEVEIEKSVSVDLEPKFTPNEASITP